MIYFLISQCLFSAGMFIQKRVYINMPRTFYKKLHESYYIFWKNVCIYVSLKKKGTILCNGIYLYVIHGLMFLKKWYREKKYLR